MTLTPETIANLRQKAEAARDETDTRQPRDWDALSPRACKIAILHESLHPEYVIALLDRIATLEDAIRTAQRDHETPSLEVQPQ